MAKHESASPPPGAFARLVRCLTAGRRQAGLAGLAALVAATLIAAGAANAAVPKTFYGIVPQAPLTTSDYERMGEGKVGTLRFELFWAGVDPSPAAGDYDWSAPDAIVANAASNGIQPLPF